MNIAVIYGGTSSESEFSAENAQGVYDSLLRLGHKAEMINYDVDMLRRLTAAPPDIVFLCVQGKHHGDGTLQSILDFLHIPYTGSPAAAASLINDKILCKLLFDKYSHRTPQWFSLSKREYTGGAADLSRIGYPFVAKAPTQGASFGIGLVKNSESHGNVNIAFEFDDPILCESFVDGSAYTVGVLEAGDELIALPCIEMKDRRIDRTDGLILLTGAFSAEVPHLPASVVEDMQTMAKAVFRETGARDYARIDFMTDKRTGLAYVIEINAVPGLKPGESFLPLEAQQMGMSYDELINHILVSAERRFCLC